MNTVFVTGSFDNPRSRDVRFLEEAAKHGRLHVAMWSDEAVRRQHRQPPQFTQEERVYFLRAIRFVDQVTIVELPGDVEQLLMAHAARPSLWVLKEEDDTPQMRSFCAARQIAYAVVTERELARFPLQELENGRARSTVKKVVVTGCFDWLHSGHVRFFEETSALGDLYVVLGHDANVNLLKGEGHPLFPEDERRYMVQAIRYVKQALVSTGHGWMDAEPEISRIRPDIYAVNEDGDRPEKRAFCEERGLEYVVLRRLPKEGLPQRTSTYLRGY